MAYKIVKQKKGHAVIDMATSREIATHVSLSKAHSLVDKEAKATELQRHWFFPSVEKRK